MRHAAPDPGGALTEQKITVLRSRSSASQPVMHAIAGDSIAGKITLTTEPLTRMRAHVHRWLHRSNPGSDHRRSRACSRSAFLVRCAPLPTDPQHVTRKLYGRLLGSFRAKEHEGVFCVEDRASRRLDRAEQTPIAELGSVYLPTDPASCGPVSGRRRSVTTPRSAATPART